MNTSKWPNLGRSFAALIAGASFLLTTMNALPSDSDPLKGTLVLQIDVPTLKLVKAYFNGKPLEECNFCPLGVSSAACLKRADVCKSFVNTIIRSSKQITVDYSENSPGCVTVIYGGMPVSVCR